MTLMTPPMEIKWPRRHWVQPGEVAVLIDGGSTVDQDGTPNLFRQGMQVRPRFRLFPQGRRQEIVLFDAKRQGTPIRFENEVFLVGGTALRITLSLDIYYRIGNPLPILEAVHLDTPEEIETAIHGRVRHLIETAIRQRPMAFLLGSHDAVRDLLLDHPWLAENDIILEDVIVYQVVPPPEIIAARQTLVAHFLGQEGAIHRLIDDGQDTGFDSIQREEPGLAQTLVATAQAVLAGVIPEGDGHDAVLLDMLSDAWGSAVRQVRAGIAPVAMPPAGGGVPGPVPAPAAPGTADTVPAAAPLGEEKAVTIVSSETGSSVQAEVYPGDSVEQIVILAAPELGLPAEGRYRLMLGANTLTGELYTFVHTGDTLTLAPA